MLHTLDDILLYLGDGFVNQPIGEKVVVAERMFSRLDIVFLAVLDAQIDGRAAIERGTAYLVARLAFFRLGRVPIKGQRRKIEHFLEFLSVNDVFVRVVGKLVQHKQVAAKAEFVVFERNFNLLRIGLDDKISLAVFFYSLLNSFVCFAIGNDKRILICFHP